MKPRRPRRLLVKVLPNGGWTAAGGWVQDLDLLADLLFPGLSAPSAG